jgi:carbon monoxide dehydrogenase subunit G
MDMKGEYDIPAPRQAVWDALNDPEVLKQAIPGCQSLERSGENGFEATVKAKVGPVSATFKGQVELTDIDPPNGYRISGEGKGGAAGFAKGGATVSLSDLPDGGTKLAYAVDAQVGGKLAQIGSRLIDSTAKKMAGEFFSKFASLVAPADTAPAQPAVAPQPEQSAPAEPLAGDDAQAAAARAAIDAVDKVRADRKGLSPMIWIVLVVLAAGLLILLNG